jgi:NAD(P)H-quinone oxidoreductase subunit 5
MTRADQSKTVGQLSTGTRRSKSSTPAVLTRLVWLLWLASLVALVARVLTESAWELYGTISIDGLTVLVWVVVTVLSGILHSYSRRYMEGTRDLSRFFTRVFGFTLIVMVLVAADHVVLFAAAWLAMGLVMSDLIGFVRGWPQAQRAASFARRYFLASTALLAVALATLWQATGETSISGILASVDAIPRTAWLLAVGALLLAAMIQSALMPFHTWLLSSMTAPTPASALMHAGFVNAGGLLLTRFAPVVDADPGFMLLVVVIGAVSALLGKLLKSVQSDVKRRLGCSTVGQMGFMIMQAGLGFFGAAITHLVLHGFYKAYLFLSASGRIERTTPTKANGGTDSTGIIGRSVTGLAALSGGGLFAALTGKGTSFDSGLLLTLLVVLTTLHATRNAVRHTSLPPTVRYGVVPLLLLPSITVYGMAYKAITGLMKDLPVVTSPAEFTVVHGFVAAAFLVAYIAIETGVYQRSDRLYVTLVNATQPPSGTLLTSTEEYNER